MIKSLLIWQILWTTSATDIKEAKDILIIDDIKLNVIVKGRDIYSQDCKNLEKCFKLPTKMRFYPNQNPLFSLCYQSEGTPRFAIVKSSKEKVQVCTKEAKVVELDKMMSFYNLKTANP